MSIRMVVGALLMAATGIVAAQFDADAVVNGPDPLNFALFGIGLMGLVWARRLSR